MLIFFKLFIKEDKKCHIQLQQRFWLVVCGLLVKPSHRKFRWYERLGFNKKKIVTPACLSKHFWHAKLNRKGSHKKVNHRLKREFASSQIFSFLTLVSCIHDLSVQFQIPEMLSLQFLHSSRSSIVYDRSANI